MRADVGALMAGVVVHILHMAALEAAVVGVEPTTRLTVLHMAPPPIPRLSASALTKPQSQPRPIAEPSKPSEHGLRLQHAHNQPCPGEHSQQTQRWATAEKELR